MRNTVYARLYDRLAELIPHLDTAQAGAAFCALSRSRDELTVFCHVLDADQGMLLVELAMDRNQGGAVLPAPWMKLRVDTASRLAEVLEVENAQGYQVIYTGGQAAHPQRAQINLFALNWLQAMLSTSSAFLPVDMPVAA